MRENEASSDRASAFASIVFPTPGKSSRIRWPSATRLSTQRRSVSSGACTTRARLPTIASIVRAASALRRDSGSLMQQLLGSLYDGRGDPVFRRLADPLLALRLDENDLVVHRVESHAGARDVVVDDEVHAFRDQLLARAGEATGAVVGREADENLAVLAPSSQLAEDVPRGLERQLPVGFVLRTLVPKLLARPVVGDGRRHEHEV